MKRISFLILACLTSPLAAQYAPIPAQERGFPLVVRVSAGLGYDDNLFSAASEGNKRESAFLLVRPEFRVNLSLTDQTFFQSSYSIAARYYDDRPSEDSTLDHRLEGLLSHMFSERTRADLVFNYNIIDAPEAVLETDPVTDEPTVFGQFNQTYDFFSISPQLSHQLTALFRADISYTGIFVRYDDSDLARGLDRNENNGALALAYIVNPRLDAVGEIRYREVTYQQGTRNPDSESYFYLVGADYELSELNSVGARVGVEKLKRTLEGLEDATNPFAEIRATYAYAPRANVRGTLNYSTRTTSSPSEYPDREILSFRVVVSQPLAPTLDLGVSAEFRDEAITGNPTFFGVGRQDLAENEYRLGLSLTWKPNDNWAVVGDYSYINRESEVDGDPISDADVASSDSRERERNRITFYVRYSFGVDPE